MKYGMRQNQKREPVTLPPEISTQQCLVFNQKGKILTVFRVVSLTIFPDGSTKDTSHAFFFLRKIKLFHRHSDLGMAGLPSGALQYCNKKPRAQDSG